MAVAYKEALEDIQNNPIKDFIEGEDRVTERLKKKGYIKGNIWVISLRAKE